MIRSLDASAAGARLERRAGFDDGQRGRSMEEFVLPVQRELIVFVRCLSMHLLKRCHRKPTPTAPVSPYPPECRLRGY